jgi:6-phosphogluconate dehydrogenase
MASAIHARFNSSFKKEREHYGKAFETRIKPVKIALDQLKKCYDFSRWINHHQGFEMLSLAAKKYNWSLNLGEVASVWSEGCIIKSELMNFCMSLFEKETSLLLSAEFAQKLKHGKEGWKTTLQNALSNEISVPCMQAAWSYFAALKTEKSTANLIQAQRDFFGAHGFFRIDQDFDKLQHGPWSTN